MAVKIKIVGSPFCRAKLALIVMPAALALSACTEAPAQDTTESRRTEVAVARMEAEQTRTDQAEARKRAERAEAYKRDLEASEIKRGIRSSASGPD